MTEHWIGTVSGKQVSYDNPQPEQFDIHDIARGLSNVCRFAGQLDCFYSVAQHSLCCAATAYAETGDRRVALQALLHDAAEAYTGDMPTPWKSCMGPVYKKFEKPFQRAIFMRFDAITGAEVDGLHPAVHESDQRWLITERNQLQPGHTGWHPRYEAIEPYPGRISVLSAPESERFFLFWFHYYSRQTVVPCQNIEATSNAH